MVDDQIIDELLVAGLDDWVYVAEVAWIAKSEAGAWIDAEQREKSLEIIREVLSRGLMEVGDVTDGGFFAWQLPIEEALDRIERDWRALGRSPSIGDVCWLSSTPAGDERANRVLEKRGWKT